MLERRAGLEFRVAGRTLSGTAMRYGEVSPSFRERFMPGAFAPIGNVALNLQHDPGRELARTGRGLILADGPRALELRAELSGTAELELVRRGALNGFSVEFHALRERREAGVRVVERAALTGIALVDAGAYPGATAEVRALAGRTMRARIPSGAALDCECVGAGCKVRFLQEALAEAIREGIEDATRTIIAVHGDYKAPLASTARGTLRARMVGEDAEVEIDLPDSDAGREVLAAAADAGVVVRPYIDRSAAEATTDAAGVTTYSRAPIRAFVVSATDKREGWPDPALVPTPGLDPEGRRAAPERRRRIWL